MFFGTSADALTRVACSRVKLVTCVLAVPPAEVLKELDSQMVAATIVAGEVVFERG